MPRKVFTAGEILTAADVNTNLMDQAVMVFDDSAARGSAIPSPSEGMVTYLKDTDSLDKFDGSNFVPVGIAPAILQVVSTAKTDVFSASSTFASITDLSATITPSSSSSKILVMTQVTGSTSDIGGAVGLLRQLRDSTVIHVGDASGGADRVSGSYSGRVHNANVAFTASWTVLDEPSTTSAVVYSVEGRSPTGTFFVNRSTDLGANTALAVSSITLMEVAG